MENRTKLFVVFFYAALLLHLPSTFGSFVWDDQQMIVTNEEIRDLANVPAFFTHNYFGTRANSELFRPLVNVSLALDFGLWGDWGASSGKPVGPTGFRLSNVLLHLLAGVLLYMLLRRLTDRPFVPEVGAFLFLVHPASAEPVGWIVARGDLLAMVLVLATVHLHLAGRRRAWLAALAPVAYLLALFAKLSAAPAPILILLVEHCFRGVRFRDLLRRSDLVRYAAYLVPIVVYVVIRDAAMGTLTPEGPGLTWADPPLLPAMASAGAILCRHGLLFLFPAGMCADYSADPVFRTGHLAELGGRFPVILLALAVPVAVIVAFRLRKRTPWLSFAVLWFFVGLLPVSQLIRTGNVMADRFFYLPAAGACAGLAAGLLALPRARLGLIALVVVAFGAATFSREAVWRDDVSMNLDVLSTHNYPESSDAWNRLGLAYDGRGRPARADHAWRRAVEFGPENRYALLNLGALRLQMGELAEARNLLTRALGASRRRDRLRASIAYNLSLIPTAETRLLLASLWPQLAHRLPGWTEVERVLEVAGILRARDILRRDAVPCERAPMLVFERLEGLDRRLKELLPGVR